MTVLPPFKSLLTGVAGAAIVAGFVFTPVSVDFDQGHFVFKASAALASDDNSDDNSSDDNSSDDGSDSGDNSSSNGDSGDNSSSSDDADNSSGDNSSSDNSSSDNSSSDNGDSNDSGSHDSNDDSSSGSSSNNDTNDDTNGDHNPSARPLQLSVFLDSLQNGSTLAKAETDGSSVEIVYSDGWKEEIHNGRYELTDPNGNTILSRPVNARDIARLNSVF